MFTKLTVEAEPLGQLPSRLTTGRSRARQGAGQRREPGQSRARQGVGPSDGFFRPWNQTH